LRDFRGRHGSASQAIGYGKTLMVLHMLRRDLGDETFVAGLRRFYRENRFRTASFDDLRRAFEQESGRELKDYFDQWTTRTGAPELALADVRVERKTTGGYVLHGRVEQTQGENPFPLQVPLVVHLEGGDMVEHRVPLGGRSAHFELELPAAPIRVDADPRFDLFRTLAPGESPATLSALFGAESGLIVLSADETAELAEQYRSLADAWRSGSPGWEIATDENIGELPSDRPVWLFGWSNRFAGDLAADAAGFRLDRDRQLLSLPGGDFPGAEFSLALVRERNGQPVGWVSSPDPAALAGLARKLPHYGKYSYLAFQGQTPTNRLKGQWPVQDSRLMAWFGERCPLPTPPPRQPLTAIID
jgi:hypothetical protein